MNNSGYIGVLPGQIVLYGNKPVDLHYGPYTDLSIAYDVLYDPDEDIYNVYYGKTIGIYRYGDNGEIIGVDEWWWQPNCVKLNNGTYADGFVLKFPANNANTISESVTKKVLSVNNSGDDFNSDWKDDTGDDVDWNQLEQSNNTVVSEIIDQEEP